MPEQELHNQNHPDDARTLARLEQEIALLKTQHEAHLRARALIQFGQWEQDLTTGAFFWSQEVFEIFGLSPETFTPSVERILLLHLPEDRTTVQENLSRLKTQGGTSTFNTRITRPDGTLRHLRVSAIATCNDQGQPVLLQGIINDITSVTTAIAESHRHLNKYRFLFDNMAQGVFYLSLDKTPTEVNPAALAMFGLTREEFLQSRRDHPLWALFGENDAPIPPASHPTALALLTQSEVKDFTAGIRNARTGELVWVSINAMMLEDPATGEPTSVITTLHDITALKKASASLRKSEEHLAHAYKMEALGTLSGGIAHEFNNILGIILGNAELALEDLEKWHPATDALKEIRVAALRSRDVVSQLLHFSRKSHRVKKFVPLQDILRDTIKLLAASLPSSIQITDKIPGSLPLIKADSTQIRQVLINVSTNAAHAMENNGHLSFALAKLQYAEPLTINHFQLEPGSYLQLTARDTGTGIPAENLPKVFDPYFTTKKIGEGTGMGLSVIHGIMKDHNGAVWIESTPGEGTAVHMVFPVAAQSISL
ncbi:PAS domain S-box protein [Myxococcota bacterium]|nr:PAS domain S-box protein [Myxococcota bacterium]MBU1536985.1 PAS domain S-box protein [Myxococcota bacterium]